MATEVEQCGWDPIRGGDLKMGPHLGVMGPHLGVGHHLGWANIRWCDPIWGTSFAGSGFI